MVHSSSTPTSEGPYCSEAVISVEKPDSTNIQAVKMRSIYSPVPKTGLSLYPVC